MPLLIYNSLTRTKEPFVPLDPAGKKVTFYNCGPTVYDRFHVGNARAFVTADIARRYLEWKGYEVAFVQNLTDIDDKIIARAAERGVSAETLAREYAEAYYEDAKKLRIRPATAHPAATEYVDRMIDFMKQLEAKGLAYASGGSLYFRVRRVADYGKLSGRSPDRMREGARVEVNEDKEDPLDFVLWKAAKPGEPKWPSPWGEGRPGWHTECAVMTRELLGETIDIHSGGIDLQFPHHENEIAQREGLSGRPFARYWMHNGFLNIESEKMSKSLGNIMHVDDVLKQYPVQAVRYFFFSAHYRHPMDYNAEALDSARLSIEGLNAGFDVASKVLAQVRERDGDRLTRARGDRSTDCIRRFEEAMNDDFNSPRALAVLHEIVNEIHALLNEKGDRKDYAKLADLVREGGKLIEFFGLRDEGADVGGSDADSRAHQAYCEILERIRQTGRGDLQKVLSSGVDAARLEGIGVDELIRRCLDARSLARESKLFPLADAIRSILGEAGITIEDRPEGAIYRRS